MDCEGGRAFWEMRKLWKYQGGVDDLFWWEGTVQGELVEGG